MGHASTSRALTPGGWPHSECLQRSVQTGKSSSQQVFWHSDFFFLRSLLLFFPHFLMFFEFRFLIVMLAFLDVTEAAAVGFGRRRCSL